MPHWILLPGLDGTGLLFEPIKAAVPKDTALCVVAYPTQTLRSYQCLVELVLAALPHATPYIIIAESFSGPIAIQAAARARPSPHALVLCASFAACPLRPIVGAIARWGSGLLLRVRPPEWFVRRYLLGRDAPQELIEAFYRAWRSVSVPVLVNRLDSLLQIDVLSSLAALAVPVLYIRGSHDRLVGERSLRAIQSCRADIQVETVQAPHMVLQRQPERCVEIIQRFLDQRAKDQATISCNP